MSKTPRTDHQRLDGWVNTLTGLGLLGSDKRMGATGSGFLADTLDRSTCRSMWRSNWAAAKIIEALPKEMLRAGYEVTVPGDTEASRRMADLHGDLGIRKTLKFALCKARCEGGSVVIIGADDGQASDQPLNLDRVQSVRWLNVLGPDQLSPWAYYDNPLAKDFGEPSVYQVRTLTRNGQASTLNSGVLIHESRLIRFDGVRVGGKDIHGDGWGDSVLLRPNEVLRDFGQTWGSVAILLKEFAQGVFKFADLAEMMATDRDDVVHERIRMSALSKSIANTMMMDKEESFERVTVPLGGLPEMMQQLAILLSASADMPVTVFMGQSPAGMNATGESDLQIWRNHVTAEQNDVLRPALNRLNQILFRSSDGPTGGKEPASWSIKFRPLHHPSQKEEADTRFVMAQTDEKYVHMGAVDPSEITASRFGGDGFSVDTKLNTEARAAMAKAEEEARLKEQGNEVDPETALNGAQVSSMLEIVKLVALGHIPRESAVEMIAAAFPVDKAQAERILGSAGKGFTPTIAAPPQSPTTPPTR